jgi:hypothetical protein
MSSHDHLPAVLNTRSPVTTRAVPVGTPVLPGPGLPPEGARVPGVFVADSTATVGADDCCGTRSGRFGRRLGALATIRRPLRWPEDRFPPAAGGAEHEGDGEQDLRRC